MPTLMSITYAFALSLFNICFAVPGDENSYLLVTPASHPAVDDKLYVCDFQGTERSISLTYAKRPPLPCEVTYHREQEGVPYQTLWQAQFDAGFCEKKLQNLLDNLKQVGWSCQEF